MFASKPSKSNRMTKGIDIFTAFSWLLWVKIGKYTIDWSYQNPKSRIVFLGLFLAALAYTFQRRPKARNNKKKNDPCTMNDRRIFQDMFFWAASTRKWGDIWWFQPGKLGKFAGFAKEKHLQIQLCGSVTKFPAAEKISLRFSDVFVFGWCFLLHHCYIFSSPECFFL